MRAGAHLPHPVRPGSPSLRGGVRRFGAGGTLSGDGRPLSATQDGRATARQTIHQLRGANSRSAVSIGIPSELVRRAACFPRYSGAKRRRCQARSSLPAGVRERSAREAVVVPLGIGLRRGRLDSHSGKPPQWGGGNGKVARRFTSCNRLRHRHAGTVAATVRAFLVSCPLRPERCGPRMIPRSAVIRKAGSAIDAVIAGGECMCSGGGGYRVGILPLTRGAGLEGRGLRLNG